MEFGEIFTLQQSRATSRKCDELYLLHQYRCVITDVANHQIIDLLRERTKATVISYLQSLPNAIKEHIAVVCTDIWASYHDAVHEVLPHAKLVVDKFHVLKLLSGCLETVRKEVRKSLTDKQRDIYEAQSENCAKSRYFLVRNTPTGHRQASRLIHHIRHGWETLSVSL